MNLLFFPNFKSLWCCIGKKSDLNEQLYHLKNEVPYTYKGFKTGFNAVLYVM